VGEELFPGRADNSIGRRTTREDFIYWRLHGMDQVHQGNLYSFISFLRELSTGGTESAETLLGNYRGCWRVVTVDLPRSIIR
jgi:hypothetical protein